MHRYRHSLLVGLVGCEHQRKRMSIVCGTTRRSLVAFESHQEGPHQFPGCGSKHVQWLSGQDRGPLAAVKLGAAAHRQIELEAWPTCSRPDAGARLEAAPQRSLDLPGLAIEPHH